MFEQAVLNIINNAMVHGGPKLQRVDLEAKIEGDTLKVLVSDDGTGIVQQDFDRALGRFSQIGPSAGSGLGLPIASAVTEAFGGEIELTNREGIFAVSMSFPTAMATVDE
jgi:two-component system sensor histidine kinase TctE